MFNIDTKPRKISNKIMWAHTIIPKIMYIPIYMY